MEFGVRDKENLRFAVSARLRSIPSKLIWHLQEHPLHLPTIVWKNLVYPLTPYWAEVRFDRALGIDTRRFQGEVDFASDQERAAAAVDYDPTPPAIAEHLIGQVAGQAHGFTFVDFGAGKGRVMILAARHPFAKVAGVEWSEPLHRIARANLAKVARRDSTLAPMELSLGDATEYRFPKTPSVLYFFNPFDYETTRRVAENLAESLVAAPRKIVVISYSPPHICRIFAEALKTAGTPVRIPRQKRFRDFEAAIFETCGTGVRAGIRWPASPSRDADGEAAATYALLYMKPGEIGCDYVRGLPSLQSVYEAAAEIERGGGAAEMIFEELGPQLAFLTGKSEIQTILDANRARPS